jgi:hypothetical protein
MLEEEFIEPEIDALPTPDPHMYDPEEDTAWERYGKYQAEWKKLQRLTRFPKEYPGPRPNCKTASNTELAVANRTFIAWMNDRYTPRAVTGVFNAVVFSQKTDDLTAAKILRRQILKVCQRPKPDRIDWDDLEDSVHLNPFRSKGLRFYIARQDLLGDYTVRLSGCAGPCCGDGITVTVGEMAGEFGVMKVLEQWVS